MKVHMITEQSVIFKTKKAGLTGEDQTKTIDVDIFFPILFDDFIDISPSIEGIMYFVYSSMIVVGSFHVEETVSQQTHERPFLQPGTRTRLSTEMIFVVFF